MLSSVTRESVPNAHAELHLPPSTATALVPVLGEAGNAPLPSDIIREAAAAVAPATAFSVKASWSAPGCSSCSSSCWCCPSGCSRTVIMKPSSKPLAAVAATASGTHGSVLKCSGAADVTSARHSPFTQGNPPAIAASGTLP
ncbi:hypothetical protein Vafri_16801 [Volvox africanus]|uniref:Uncharacterized protein n=1 Tax=Volvox africanus TaxID=51714 RepID=A0A8J4F9G0_9CHLO|nr:hypothetical protein Vafri_16801 [Volvox africanus]